LNPNLIYLIQSDTTVGLHSHNLHRLQSIKSRPIDKNFIKVVSSLNELKKHQRVPTIHKQRVRRAKKTTFAYSKKRAIRVSKDKKFNFFLQKFGWLYSSSANQKAKKYDFDWSNHVSDVVVNPCLLKESSSSKIYKINNHKIKKIR
jgi:tRNA A37 threonylcarbamoyladenosine synthetase subunit TsaC/SUA5/YrdC